MFDKIYNEEIAVAFKDIGKKISDKRRSMRKKFPGISKKLNISINYLKYIEDGKVNKIPEHIPVKGFIKSYAKLLNVDIEEQLDLIESSPNKQLSTVVSKNKIGKKPNMLLIYFIVVFCSFLLIIYLIQSHAESKKSDEDSFYGSNKRIIVHNKKLYSWNFFFGMQKNMFYPMVDDYSK